MSHYHLHVFPRHPGDRLYEERGEVVPMEEVDRVAALLRQHYRDV